MTGRDDSEPLPDMAILAPAAPPSAKLDLTEAVSSALQAVGGPTSLTVVVNDPQRDTHTRSVLELLAERIDPRDLRLLVATGSHRIPQDQRASFQAELTAGIPVRGVGWHDCRADSLISIGGLWRGHPWLAQETPLLAIGSVEPHYFAGYTGAHKTLTIGCASYEDIEANHANALSLTCRPGKLSGNRVYHGVLDMLAALERLRPLAAISLVQFVELLAQAGTYQQAIDVMAARGYTLGDHKAVKLRYLTDPACRGVKVILASEGISHQQARLLGMTKVGDLREALSLAGLQPGDEGVYLIRDAANLAVYAGSAPRGN